MNKSTFLIKIAKAGYIATSLLLCFFGLPLILKANSIPTFLIKLGGVICIVFGIFKLVGYFSKDLYRLAFQFDFELGVIYIILGLIIALDLGKVINYIAVPIGLLVMVDGMFKLRISKDAKDFGIERSWMILAMGLFTSILGGCLALTVEKNLELRNILLGLVFLAEGSLNLLTVVMTVKIINHQKEDVIDIENRKR